MQYTIHEAKERLLGSISRYYTISRMEAGALRGPDEHRGIREAAKVQPPTDTQQVPLTAICEYYEESGEHFIFRANELWSTHQEEFIFLFDVPTLTPAVVHACIAYAHETGMQMAHIGSGHMYTYITPIFICDSAAPAAQKELQACKIYKSFKFSFHGWMEVHAACVELGASRMYFNKAGRCLEKSLKQVFKQQ